MSIIKFNNKIKYFWQAKNKTKNHCDWQKLVYIAQSQNTNKALCKKRFSVPYKKQQQKVNSQSSLKDIVLLWVKILQILERLEFVWYTS